ncbi:MAG: hypothetical protein LBL80_02415 [Ruminococcus sp.]|jgi:hypothetical protein|nr:hypothetical protein [Ruminococcus sp.]
MKKLIALLFTMLMVVTFPVTAFAAEEKLTVPDVKDHLPYYYTLLSAEEKEDYLVLRKAVINHDKRIEFTASEVTQGFLNKALAIMLEYDSLTFDIENISTKSSGYSMNGNFRASKYELVFEYLMTKDNYLRAVAYTDKKIQKFLKTIPEDMSTRNILVKAHDFIAKQCVYDLEYKNGYTAYAAVVYGKALCEGYAKAFQYICEEIGVPCVIAVGDSYNSNIGHAWNKVKIGDNWYNVDVTNDDTDSEMNGYVSKSYMFLADSEYPLAKEINTDELDEPVASDTTRSFYELSKQTFATSADAIEYMKTKLQGDLPVNVAVAFADKAEYKKFLDDFFDAASKTPALKKYSEATAYYYTNDMMNTIILYFYSE